MLGTLLYIPPFHVILTTTLSNEYSHVTGKQAEVHKDNKLTLKSTELEFIPRFV